MSPADAIQLFTNLPPRGAIDNAYHVMATGETGLSAASGAPADPFALAMSADASATWRGVRQPRGERWQMSLLRRSR